jgi:hypothetical protein
MLDKAAQRGAGWVELARDLDVPLTWMIKVSAQDKRSTPEYFFNRLAPLLPAMQEIGLHVHFDDDERKNYIREPQERAALISEGASILRGFGVRPRVFRAGCLRAEDSDIRALDAEGLFVDSSISPGSKGNVDLADWRRATLHAPYHTAPDDLTRPGNSRLIEAPLVSDGTDRNPMWLDTWQTTEESLEILDTAITRGDHFLCLIGHDGSVDLERVRVAVAKLRAAGTRFVTLSGLADAWTKAGSQ